MALTRGSGPSQLWPGIKVLAGETYNQYSKEHLEIYGNPENSDKAGEEGIKLALFGLGQAKSEGMTIAPDDGAGEVWKTRLEHATYAIQWALTQEAVEDNLYADVMKRYTKAGAKSMAQLKEYNGVYQLDNAFGNATLGGDGKVLCATDHQLKYGGTNSNRPATGNDFNEASVEAAVLQVAGWKDERGLPINAKLKKAILPIGYLFIAERLMKTQQRVGTTDNDINAVKSLGIFPQGWTINHYLGDVNAWFATTDVQDGLKFYQRIAMQSDNDKDFNTGNNRFKMRERYVFGYIDPLGIYGSPGAS